MKDRLVKEITYWDHRAEQLKLQEQAGKPNARLNSGEARKRADALQERLDKRLEELKLEAQISPRCRRSCWAACWSYRLGCWPRWRGASWAARALSPPIRRPWPRGRRGIVMEIERELGFEPIDREFEQLGYDIESRVPGTGKLRFIEVKGRASGAETITVTKNEILYSLNKPEDYILAMVEFTAGRQAPGALPSPSRSTASRILG